MASWRPPEYYIQGLRPPGGLSGTGSWVRPPGGLLGTQGRIQGGRTDGSVYRSIHPADRTLAPPTCWPMHRPADTSALPEYGRPPGPYMTLYSTIFDPISGPYLTYIRPYIWTISVLDPVWPCAIHRVQEARYRVLEAIWPYIQGHIGHMALYMALYGPWVHPTNLHSGRGRARTSVRAHNGRSRAHRSLVRCQEAV